MRTYQVFGYGLAVALFMTVLAASSAMGEDKDTPKDRNPAIGKLDDKTSGTNIRASKLIGVNIQNDQGDSVGEVNDIVLDGKSGKVRYLAVTYGGFLGVGNKMFAVPFEAFHCHHDPSDPDKAILTLHVTKEKLNGAVGFDETSWPDFGNMTFTSELDKRYGVERKPLRDRGVDVRVDRDGVDVNVDKKPIRDE